MPKNSPWWLEAQKKPGPRRGYRSVSFEDYSLNQGCPQLHMRLTRSTARHHSGSCLRILIEYKCPCVALSRHGDGNLLWTFQLGGRPSEGGSALLSFSFVTGECMGIVVIAPYCTKVDKNDACLGDALKVTLPSRSLGMKSFGWIKLVRPCAPCR